VSSATDALGVVAPDEEVVAVRLGPEDEGDTLELILGLGEEEDALKFGEGLKLARWYVVGGNKGAPPGRGKSLRVLISASRESKLRMLGATLIMDFV
jgi:hypothetical protein